MFKFKRSLILSLIIAMMMGNTVMAAENAMDETQVGRDQTVNGSMEVEDPVYRVVVPTDFTFAVDAFQQREDTQIVSPALAVINKSNIPVKLSVALSLGTTTDTKFVSSDADVKDDETSRTIHLQARIADTIEEEKAAAADYKDLSGVDIAGMFAGTVDGVTKYYETTDIATALKRDTESPAAVSPEEMVDVIKVTGTAASTPVMVTLGTSATKLEFALAASEYIEYYTDAADATKTAKAFKTVAENQASSISFDFAGKVNPNIVWADGDFSATAVYNFRGMTADDYAAYSNENTEDGKVFVENAHGYIGEKVDPVEPTFASSTPLLITWSGDKGTSALTEITSIIVTNNGKTFDVYKELAATWGAANPDIPNDKVTLDNGVAALADLVGANTVAAVITYTDASGKTDCTGNVTLTLKAN